MNIQFFCTQLGELARILMRRQMGQSKNSNCCLLLDLYKCSVVVTHKIAYFERVYLYKSSYDDRINSLFWILRVSVFK